METCVFTESEVNDFNFSTHAIWQHLLAKLWASCSKRVNDGASVCHTWGFAFIMTSSIRITSSSTSAKNKVLSSKTKQKRLSM